MVFYEPGFLLIHRSLVRAQVEEPAIKGTDWRHRLQFVLFVSISKIYIYPRHLHFKKEGGPSAGSSFEQISMQRLTGVPSPISGGTGWVGSGWAGI